MEKGWAKDDQTRRPMASLVRRGLRSRGCSQRELRSGALHPDGRRLRAALLLLRPGVDAVFGSPETARRTGQETYGRRDHVAQEIRRTKAGKVEIGGSKRGVES